MITKTHHNFFYHQRVRVVHEGQGSQEEGGGLGLGVGAVQNLKEALNRWGGADGGQYV